MILFCCAYIRTTTGIFASPPVVNKAGHTWLFLINGGERSYAEENVARNEFKKIYHCFISNKLVKPEHVVCASGGKEKLFQHETLTFVSKLSSVVPQIYTQLSRGELPPRTGGLQLVCLVS